jgi:pyruvate/2-oxoglutarate/acetoin dehydrogenase E1 component
MDTEIKGKKMNYREAVRAGIRDALDRDPKVFLMGADVGRYGGCFAVSKGLFDDYGPERIRDMPLLESTIAGIGIGCSMNGMRPIVEIMTVNFSLLALDQILNTAATLMHMSGGLFNVPVTIRMATGAGRQLGAQHAHSLEGWYAHIPGIRIVAPSTIPDAYGMLWPSLEEPNPVLIFEQQVMYNMEGYLPENPAPVDIDHAAVRHVGDAVTVITYGSCAPKSIKAAEMLAAEGIQIDVIDLRTLRPLDDEAIFTSVAKTHRALIVEEGWRSGSLAAEISSRIQENIFYELDMPVERLCSAEVPMPYSHHMEEYALPQPEKIVNIVKRMVA